MARALSDILTELNSTYNPQRTAQQDIYNKGIASIDPQQEADLQGLEAAKRDSFGQIEQGANRRGLFFSGIPLAEQAKYVGQNYLPSVANLKNRYASIKGNLYNTLATALNNIDEEQRRFGQDIFSQELARDERMRQEEEARRQFNEQLAANERQAAASRAASGGGGAAVFTGNSAVTRPTPLRAPAQQQTPQYIGNDDFRGRLAYLAQQGNKDAAIALKYYGNDGIYNGPVANIEELIALQRAGIKGNYQIPGLTSQGANTPGLTVNKRGGLVLKDVSF